MSTEYVELKQQVDKNTKEITAIKTAIAGDESLGTQDTGLIARQKKDEERWEEMQSDLKTILNNQESFKGSQEKLVESVDVLEKTVGVFRFLGMINKKKAALFTFILSLLTALGFTFDKIKSIFQQI